MAWLDLLRDVLFKLTPFLPGIVGFLIVIAMALLATLLWMLRRSRQRNKDAEKDKPAAGQEASGEVEPFALEPDDLPLLPLKRGFKHALRILKAHVSGRDWRYAIPWYLLIGPEDSGKSTLAANTDMNLPVGAPSEDWEDVRPACKWWFFDRGVVLDIAGQFIRAKGSRASDRKGWAHLLRLLDRYRPRRPVDGIILAIPIEDLIDHAGEPRPPEDIAQRAEALYKKLWQAQSRLGLAFPVYAVVTKCDRLAGFKSFVEELPEHMHHDMLGWSSPYSFETEFRREWVEEALDSVDGAVRAAQMEIFADRADLPDAEGMFRLPAEIEKMRQPLAHYMKHLFKPSAYHEAFSLRGLYLTGDGGAPPSGALRPLPVLPGVYSGPKETVRPAFLRDLFEDKIFPEKGLARPAKRALLSRNRTALAAQAATIVLFVGGGLGLWYDHASVSAGVDQVRPFVQQVQRDVAEVTALRDASLRRGEPPQGRGSFDREKALTLLDGMTRLEIDSFDSLFMPTSWLSDIDDRVVAVTTEAFNLFILQSMRSALQERGQALVEGRLPSVAAPASASGSGAGERGGVAGQAGAAVSEAAGGALPSGFGAQLSGASEGGGVLVGAVDRGPEYERLTRFVAALRAFEDAIARYNALRSNRELRDVKALVGYLFNVSLSDEFLENAGFYEAALDNVDSRPIDLESLRGPAVSRYRSLMREAITALYAENPLLVGLRRLGVALDDAANRRASGIEALEAIRARTESLREMMGRARFDWMDDPSYDPATAFVTLLERVGGSALLGPNLAAEFEAAARRGVADVRDELPDLQSFAIGPLLAREAERSVLRFAEPVADLDGVLQTLFGRPFMATGRLQPLPAAPPVGVAAQWNADQLDAGLSLIDGYDGFMRQELDRAPSALHTVIRDASAERLALNVNDRIARALEVGRGGRSGLRAEEVLRREVASFTAAASSLQRILAAYDELAREDSYLDLTDLVSGHAVALIEEADRLFRQEAFYEPQGGDFSWWDGDPRMALTAFRARDLFDLRDTLALQRQRISVIAGDYVRPLVGFLSERDLRLQDSAAGLVAKWRRITDELEKYELRRADNSISELEGFITGAMMDVSFANCSETLDQAGVASTGGLSGDFFIARMQRLERGIRERCAQLAGVQAQTSYEAVRTAFEDRLAGHYPFVTGGHDPDVPEVSPRDLEAFFALYDREGTAARQALEESVELGFARDRALDFLDRMDQVRAVFAPWLEGPAGDDAPVYDVAASFRVNREREAGANQVIEWALSVGNTRLDQRSGERTARWGVGEPVILLLRWAENSTMVPAEDTADSDITVRDRTVRMRYTNAWSLFELIRRHRAGSDDFERFVDPRPHTLRVDLPTRPAAGGPVERARLFVRVELTAPGDGEARAITVPVFPARAPMIE